MIIFLKEFFSFIKENKKWWLIPLFIAFLALGTLIYLGQGSVVSPFIYTLF